MIARSPVSQTRHRRGSAMLAALCFASVLALALASYLTLCLRSAQLSTRNLNFQHGIELAEIGLEETLWAMNKNNWSSWSISVKTAKKTLSGFTYDNGATGTAAMTVTNYDGTTGIPTVTVTGTTTLANGTSTNRVVTSTLGYAPLFVNALAGVSDRVKLTSANTSCIIDSYDSSLGLYSAQTPTYAAVVMSGSTSTSSATVQFNNAQIKGYVTTLSTGPSYSTSGTLRGPSTPLTTKIDASRITTSPYQPLFSENAPTGAATVLPTGSFTIKPGGAYPGGLYTSTGVNIWTDTITIQDHVVLVISGDLTINWFAKIWVKAGGSLEIHVAGNLSLDGNGIQNDTYLPQNLIIIATSNNPYTGFDMTTNTPFYGVIYTPNGSLTIGNSQTIYGSLVAQSITFSTTAPIVHYDVNLRKVAFSGISTPYTILNWSQVSP